MFTGWNFSKIITYLLSFENSGPKHGGTKADTEKWANRFDKVLPRTTIIFTMSVYEQHDISFLKH